MTMHQTNIKTVAAAVGRRERAPFRWTRKHTYIAAGAGAALVMILIAVLVVRKSSNAPPPMNAPIEAMARFVGSSTYLQLPFDRQRQYMDHLSTNRKELAESFKANKISREVAQNAENYAWCGKRLREIRLYFSAGEGEDRSNYLSSLALKEIEKDKKKKTAKAAAKTQPAVATAMDPDDALPKHDVTAVREIINLWPDDMQRQWRNFDADLQQRQGEIKREKKAASGKSMFKSGKKSRNGGAGKSGKKSGKSKTTAPAASPAAGAVK